MRTNRIKKWNKYVTVSNLNRTTVTLLKQLVCDRKAEKISTTLLLTLHPTYLATRWQNQLSDTVL